MSPLQIVQTGSGVHLGAHLDSFLEGTGIVSPELKQLELETNYLLPSNVKVKKECPSTCALLHSFRHVQ